MSMVNIYKRVYGARLVPAAADPGRRGADPNYRNRTYYNKLHRMNQNLIDSMWLNYNLWLMF